MQDKFTGKSRGFAFIEFTTSDETIKAEVMFHNKEFQGRTPTVNLARPKEDRPPRSIGDYRGERDARRRESRRSERY